MSLRTNTDDQTSDRNEKLYSIEDLFNLQTNETGNLVFQVVDGILDKEDQTTFKYFQIHTGTINTGFSRHEVLQLVDISQKIMCDIALGEKRLFSLINATVSHDMRNPTNSIQVQVQEQQMLNQKLNDVIENMTRNNVRKTRKSLVSIQARSNQITNVQISAVKVLNFLVKDMLDYA